MLEKAIIEKLDSFWSNPEVATRLSYGKCADDHAVMERFFHTLKMEQTHFKAYQTFEEAKCDIFAYIFAFYNAKRRHSTLKYQTPNQIENNYDRNKVISIRSV